jgi:DNA helicase IV
MAKVLAKAVRDRRRPLREDVRVPYGVETLRLTAEDSNRVLTDARRRARTHNAGRRFVEQAMYEALAASSHNDAEAGDVRERLRSQPAVREALEWMWPVLTPAELLNDLFGSRALLRSASRNVLDVDEQAALFRERVTDIERVTFTGDDIPLLDEARALLGPRPRRKGRPAEDDELRTFGHIVVDEAQDLSPMQLRMLSRRSLSGSMTIVGDIAQATGAWPHASWEEILEHLPDRRPARRAELTIGYRIPAPNMELAARVLRVAAPDLSPPRSIRQAGAGPRLISVADGELGAAVAAAALAEVDEVGGGNVAVIAPASLVDVVTAGLTAAGVSFGVAARNGLEEQVTVVPVGMVKGLELDATVVVEPAVIVDKEAQGMRALYVALTRATKRLAIVHAQPLPECLAE